jgi:copper chaperone CopZ
MKAITLFFLIVVTSASFAQDKNAKATMTVDGICAMCKARIEKACLNTKGVKYAQWSIETHELKLIYDARKTVVDSIKQSVLDAGHDVKELKATDAAYANVHPCCKYRDGSIIDAHDTHEGE